MQPNISYILADNSRLLRRIFDERVRGLGFTSVQARLLLSLDKYPQNNQAFFADRLEIEPITLTRIVDRLEERDWIRRQADPEDRRARLLSLTGKSRNIVESLRCIVNELNEDMMSGLKTEERADFMRILDIITENLTSSRNCKETADG